MTTFPGIAAPLLSLWSVIDESTGRIICELDVPCSTPATAAISATKLLVITCAGTQESRQEDISNPLRFLRAAMKRCRKAQELKHPTRTRRVGCAGMEVLK